MKKTILKHLYKYLLPIGIILLLLSIYLNISTMSSADTISNNYMIAPEDQKEVYDEKIAKIDNWDDLKMIVDSDIKKNNYEGIDIPIYIDDIVRRKYFHQTAYISADTNWILKGADYFFPEKFFLTAMDPRDLVKKNHGICNQQSIIFQELIKYYKFEYATIGFDIKIPNQENFGHIANAVKVGGDWFYFDPNMEPAFDRKNSLVFEKVLKGDQEVFEKLYPQYNFDLLTKEMIDFRDLNTSPAKRGIMFQRFTQIFSNFSGLLFLIFSQLIKIIGLKNEIE